MVCCPETLHCNCVQPPIEYRIYADDRAQIWCVIDEDDYQWAIQWRWCLNVKKSRSNPLKNKTYFRRAVNDWQNGVLLRTYSLYLHREILKRTGALPPTAKHTQVDHRDGNTFNNRRSNLRWATHSLNARNVNGLNLED